MMLQFSPQSSFIFLAQHAACCVFTVASIQVILVTLLFV